MPTRPDSPDPAGPAGAANPFATLGEGLGKGMDFFQDWMKAAGSALPHVASAAAGPGTGIPGWTMPTLDPAELDKRIQELRTVQFWLEQNARMIGMTIQGLEVQRMTLNTLQGMNVSMDQLKDALKVQPQAMQDLFKTATQAATSAASSAAAAASKAAAPPEPSRTTSPAPAPDATPQAASPASTQADAQPPRAPLPASSWFQGVPDEPEPTPGSDDAPAAGATPPGLPEGADLINPMRWWDTLTQQFSHLATQAVPPALRTPGMGGAGASPAPAAPDAQAAGQADGSRDTLASASPRRRSKAAAGAQAPTPAAGSDAAPATARPRTSAARSKMGR